MRRFPRWMKYLLVLLIVAGVLVYTTDRILTALNPGPAQPIPFSHRVHVTTKQISCFFCHQYAAVSDNPGMPSVDKCLLCHSIIASRFPPIARISEYKQKKQGIPWVRVNRVPDFTHFSHQIHLARGFDCSICHGNIKAMDRVRQVQQFSMGFCVDCHKKYMASVDCVVCHR